MSSNLYLKLPHRLLHQPTWIRLSDRMKALAIQIALVAADTDAEADGGRLPPLDDLAVLLRVDPEILESDLVALGDIGYTARKDGHWIAAEFLRWQAVETPAAKRMRRLRAKQKHSKARGGVTVTQQSRHPVTPTEPEPEPEPETEPKPVKRASGPRAPLSPAVAIVREETHLTPPKAAHQDIDSTIQDLDLWRKIVHAWVLAGWNPRNLGGMLECYRTGEIPGTRRNGKGIPEPKGFDAIRQYERLRGCQDGL